MRKNILAILFASVFAAMLATSFLSSKALAITDRGPAMHDRFNAGGYEPRDDYEIIHFDALPGAPPSWYLDSPWYNRFVQGGFDPDSQSNSFLSEEPPLGVPDYPNNDWYIRYLAGGQEPEN